MLPSFRKEKRARELRPLLYQATIPVDAADHGTLAGLGDDDHAQYVHLSAGRTIQAQHSFSPTVAQAPFVLGVNAQGQKVTGLNADTVDGYEGHAPVTVGNTGLGLSGQQLSLALAATSGLAISSGLMLADAIAGAGLTISGKVLSIAAADTSLTVNADSLQVRLAATSGLAISSGLMIADGIAGAGLTISGKVLAVGAGDGLTVAADTVSLTTPGSLSVSSANAAAGNHTHAITSTSDVGTTPAASILASNATGDLQLRKLILGSSDPGDRALWIDPTQSSRVSAYGIVNTPDAGIGQTYTSYVVYYGRADVGDGTTINTISTFYVSPPTLGSGTSITVLKGVNVLDLSGAGIVQTYAYDALGTTDYNRFRGFMGVGLNLDYSYTGARLNVSDTGTQLRLLYNADIAKAARFTVDSSGYLTLDVDGNQLKLDSDVRIQSANYASQLTGWGITYSGSADFRYLYADELHVKTFIADLEQALAGGQIISKSVAILYSDFVCPAAGGTATIYVEDLPGAADMQVFQSGDYVGLRQFSRAGGGLTVAWCWGTVSVPNTTYDGYQSWTFTRSTAPNAGGASGTINKGTLVLDFGTSGNGYHEVNAIDGLYAVNSPYSQIVTWTTHPLNRTLRTRMGNLYGITATTEYGLYAGTGAVSNTDQYIRLSDQNLDIHNIDLSIHNGTREVIRLDKDDGISVWNSAGGAVLRVYTGLTSTSWGGVTMEEGDVFIGDSAAGLYFDKTPSSVKLGDVDNGNYLYLAGTASYVSMYYGGVERARYANNLTFWDADSVARFQIANDGNIQMYDPSGQVRMQLLASGNIYLYDSSGVDRLAMSTSNIRMGDSAEARVLVTPTGITFYDAASSIRGVIDGSAGSFWFGDTAATERIQWDSANGLNIYNASNAAVLRAPISGAAEIVGTLAVTGSITAGAGDVTLDSTGVLILGDGSPGTLTFLSRSLTSPRAYIYAGAPSTVSSLYLKAINGNQVSPTQTFVILSGGASAATDIGFRIVTQYAGAASLDIMRGHYDGSVAFPDTTIEGNLIVDEGLGVGNVSAPAAGYAAIQWSFIDSEAIACEIYRTASTAITTGFWTPLTFPTGSAIEVRDQYNMHSLSTGTGRITIVYTGWYVISGTVEWATNTTGTRGIAFRQDGSNFIAVDSNPGAQNLMSLSTVKYLVAGDYLELCVYQDTGANLNINATADYSPYFAAARLV